MSNRAPSMPTSSASSGAPAEPAVQGGVGPLGLDPDQLAACVSCGLCLAYCPTYRVSGEEGLSPRGRIAAMRAVTAGAPADADFDRVVQTCVQCRACETACPSSVPFGRLMESTRAATARRNVAWWQRGAYWALGHHRLLLASSTAAALAQRAGVLPSSLARRTALPPLALRRPRLASSGADVWLYTGCVMDAWQREVHVATEAVLRSTGAGVAIPGPAAGCCGALHVHAGLRPQAERLAAKVMAAMPGTAPVLVNSAGCGAAMKDYGHLLGTEEARRFSARVLDVHEWLAARAERLPAPVGNLRSKVVIQDPCHLRHVQRCHDAVRTVLSPYVDIVELDDEGRCCGAGGAYSALHPELAGPIRAGKLEAVARSGATVVASANPGCAMWLAAGGAETRHPIQTLHPMQIVAQAAGIGPQRRGGRRSSTLRSPARRPVVCAFLGLAARPFHRERKGIAADAGPDD